MDGGHVAGTISTQPAKWSSHTPHSSHGTTRQARCLATTTPTATTSLSRRPGRPGSHARGKPQRGRKPWPAGPAAPTLTSTADLDGGDQQGADAWTKRPAP